MIQRILVALDSSGRAAAVFDAAAELAKRFDAVLHPVHVISVPPEFPPAARESHVDPLPAHLAAVAVEGMRKIMGHASSDVRVDEPRTKTGQPWRMILEAADELDVDLIVVGSHGYHGLDRILGTTAGTVANMARRNVLVVHDRKAILAARDHDTALAAGDARRR